MQATENTYNYDLLVIGSGPAGHKAAIEAAKNDKRVAMVERNPTVGGICLQAGTIPSKTLRESAVYLSGYRQHNVYGKSYVVKENITMDDLLFRTDWVIRQESDVMRYQLRQERVEVIHATASFQDAHTLRLDMADGQSSRLVTAQNIVIAVGSVATEADGIPFDGKNIFTSDDILQLDEIPSTLTIVGGGVIGLEYASMFAALGTRVTVIDRRQRLLTFVDEEIIDALVYHMRQYRATFRLNEEITSIELLDDIHESVRLHTASGKQIIAEKVLYSIGRTGATSSLNLEKAGLESDSRGRIKVNTNYQTAIENIYAVGDVIGFPALASAAMEQGRLAALHMLGQETGVIRDLLPYGIYSVPEISMVGKTEEELTQAGIPYEIGKAQYDEVARGQINGYETGLLKLIFHLETHDLLGVHIIGESASDLIHIGQAVLAFNGTIDYFVNTVFNYPTMAECYKIAALDGLSRISV